jgi:hypothetical protein
MSNLEIETEKITISKKEIRNLRISLWTGILAIFPYMCLAIVPWSYKFDKVVVDGVHTIIGYNPVRDILVVLGVYLGFFFGIPLGLAAIITGVLSLTKKSKIKNNVIYALIGITFGIGGFISHIWYFYTCAFCQ